MRLAFLVNDVDTEIDEYTTTRLARAACQGGHEVLHWLLHCLFVNTLVRQKPFPIIMALQRTKKSEPLL